MRAPVLLGIRGEELLWFLGSVILIAIAVALLVWLFWRSP